MTGFFRREKKDKKKKDSEAVDDAPYIDMLSSRVKDSSGNFFGEVVSADENSIVMKSKGKFYSVPTASVNNRFGDLMLAENIDMSEALRKGEEWRNPGIEVIGENTFYDFSDKIQAQQEKEDRILSELRNTRKLARKERDSILLDAFPESGSDAEVDGIPQDDAEERSEQKIEDGPVEKMDGDNDEPEGDAGEDCGDTTREVVDESDVIGEEDEIKDEESVDGDPIEEEGVQVVDENAVESEEFAENEEENEVEDVVSEEVEESEELTGEGIVDSEEVVESEELPDDEEDGGITGEVEEDEGEEVTDEGGVGEKTREAASEEVEDEVEEEQRVEEDPNREPEHSSEEI